MVKVYRLLSSVFLIDSAAFSALSADKHNEVFAAAAGKPVKFVPSFGAFGNRKRIQSALLAGEDVSTALEFSGIELTPEEMTLVARVRPVLEKIAALSPHYPWLKPTQEREEEILRNIKFQSRVVVRKGFEVGYVTGERLWKVASKCWANMDDGLPDTKLLGVLSQTYAGYHRRAEIFPQAIVIGCQTIFRDEVEYIASQKEWEPVVE
jgi:hypothetical protein